MIPAQTLTTSPMQTPSKLSPNLVAGLMLFAYAAFSPLTAAAPKAHPDSTGWEKVFAEDFSNAVTKPGDWIFENSVLVAKHHDTLWTKKSYGNFVLDLEFKVAKESNSGV